MNNNKITIQTGAGELSAVVYNDIIAQGIHILVNDEIIAAVDALADTGEVRLVIYYGDEDEPDIITVELPSAAMRR